MTGYHFDVIVAYVRSRGLKFIFLITKIILSNDNEGVG